MIVTLTIIRYRKALVPFALLAMAVHRLPMALQQGCTFWKLLGSGRNGTFDLQPDWQQWGLLACWDTREDYERFSQQSFVSKWWRALGSEQWTAVCKPIASHGKWDGKEPFGKPDAEATSGPVAVLTRATIKISRLKNFWSHVDEVAELMTVAPGYITSIGVGEAPVYRQATFSVWESMEQMKAFAYGSKQHAEVIKKTRSEGWYSEELFARFSILESHGTINGREPLAGKIQ
ncbi:spheroidene monooxygenase [Mucilaginibacter sp. PAMC 26640]|nr:spheroidene monooxygenase [Mucilaginibacter sp. PAMC 26640]